MKKVIVIFALIILIAGCSKDSIERIKPWHTYSVPGIYSLNDGSNSLIIDNLFPMASKVEFIKNHTGFFGDGALTVTRDNYETETYSGYSTIYNSYCGCYYYQWQDYVVSWNNQQTNIYKYKWEWVTQKTIRITFAAYNFNGKIEEKSFLKLLDGVYAVEEVTRKFKTIDADIISLTKDNIRIVLKE